MKLKHGEKNQEVTLARAGDTRWGSHHRTITSLIKMFPEVLKVLHYVEEEGDTISNRGTTSGLIKYFKTLEFMFYCTCCCISWGSLIYCHDIFRRAIKGS